MDGLSIIFGQHRQPPASWLSHGQNRAETFVHGPRHYPSILMGSHQIRYRPGHTLHSKIPLR